MISNTYSSNKAGSIANLKLEEVEIGAPAKGEVQVAVKAVGLNFADIFAMHGLYSATPKGKFTPGLEFSGVVEGVGEDVSNFKEGDRVMGVTKFGGYTDRINHDHRYVTLMKDDWSFEEGAAYLVQGLTAYYALVSLGDIQQNANVLIHSGAGGVGIMANRIAKHFGAITIGTIGSPKKLGVLEEEGFNKTIVRGYDFAKKLDEALDGKELNLIVESIGGKIFKAGYKRMSPQGRMVVVGASQFASPGKIPNYFKLIWLFLTRPKIDPQEMIQDNKGVLAFNLIWLYDRVHIMNEMLGAMSKMDLGKPKVGKVFAWDEMHDAINFFQSGKSTGKVVVTTNN
ncbi:MAG: zinc-binding dehydrogenase [Cyclobacteriaceae bacterium]